MSNKDINIIKTNFFDMEELYLIKNKQITPETRDKAKKLLKESIESNIESEKLIDYFVDKYNNSKYVMNFSRGESSNEDNTQRMHRSNLRRTESSNEDNTGKISIKKEEVKKIVQKEEKVIHQEKQLDEEDEQDLSCCVCMELYNEDKDEKLRRRPMSLQCPHSVCEKCLPELNKCPKCRIDIDKTKCCVNIDMMKVILLVAKLKKK